MNLFDKIKEYYMGNMLHHAIDERSYQAAEKWSQKPKYVNSFSCTYYTPLQRSLITKQYDITILLLTRGADPNFFHPKIGSALNRYLHGRHDDNAVKILALYGATLDSVHSLDKLQDILPFYEKYRQVYLKMKELEQKIQEEKPNKKREAHLQLVELWQQMERDEERLDKPNVIFQTHYRHLAFLNKQKADEVLETLSQQSSSSWGHPQQNFFAGPSPTNQNELRLRHRAKEVKEEADNKLSYHRI